MLRPANLAFFSRGFSSMGFRSRALAALVACTTLFVAGAPTLPANAEDQGSLSISAPDSVDVGWNGDITVSGSSDRSGDFVNIYVDGPNNYSFSDYAYLSTAGAFTVSFYPPSFDAQGNYDVEVDFDYSTGRASQQIFAGTATAPEFRRASTTRTSFYPRVRDQFQDDVTVHYATRQRSKVGITVLNSEGRTVRTVSPRRFEPGWPASWTWNGKTNNGGLVGVGRYRIKLTATANGLSTTSVLPVQVKSDTVTRRFSDYWRGDEYDRLRATGSCTANSYFSRATLNCWDLFNSSPDYAEAAYWFKVPRNARKFSWNVRGSRGCCDSPGKIIKSGQRVSPTRYVVKVRVDGFRAYDVFRASASWTATVRR